MRLFMHGAAALAALFLLLACAAPAYSQSAEQNTYHRHVLSGMEQLKNGHYPAAKDSFREALRYHEAGVEAHMGLGIAYYHLRDDLYAERALLRVVELDPGEPTAYQFLGELSYRRDDLEAAVSWWEKAAALKPSDPELRMRLERIRKEHGAEKDFSRDVTSHFLIKYEGREKIEAGRIVLRILEDAYGEVGRALSWYPDREIQVILYSGRQFQDVTDAPGWSGGIYDGKIRIPIGGIERETPGLRRLLYHEYTHAVVRSITQHCPTWLNEGLAQHFEGKDIDARQQAMLKQLGKSGRLPSLAELEGPFMGLGADQARSAYLFSLSAVRYVIASFGMYRVKSVLEELGQGMGVGKALNNGLTMTYEEVERGWKRSLE